MPLVKEKQLAASDVIADDTVRVAVEKDDKVEALHAGPKVTHITVEPTAIKIGKPTEYAQLVTARKLSDGTRADVTRMAKISLQSGVVVETSPRGMVRPSDKDGATNVKVAFMGKTASIPVNVSGMKAAAEARLRSRCDAHHVEAGLQS